MHSQHHQWMLSTHCLSDEILSSDTYFEHLLKNCDDYIDSTAIIWQIEKYSYFLMESFLYCIDRIEKNPTYQTYQRIPSERLEQLAKSNYFKLKVSNNNNPVETLINMMQDAKKNSYREHVFKIILEAKDISQFINLEYKGKLPADYAIADKNFNALTQLEAKQAKHTTSYKTLLDMYEKKDCTDQQLQFMLNCHQLPDYKNIIAAAAAEGGDYHFLVKLGTLGIDIEPLLQKYNRSILIRKQHTKHAQFFYDQHVHPHDKLLPDHKPDLNHPVAIYDKHLYFLSEIEQDHYSRLIYNTICHCMRDPLLFHHLKDLFSSNYFKLTSLQKKEIVNYAVIFGNKNKNNDLFWILFSHNLTGPFADNTILADGAIQNKNLELLGKLIEHKAKNNCDYKAIVASSNLNYKYVPLILKSHLKNLHAPFEHGLTLAELAILDKSNEILAELVKNNYSIADALALGGPEIIENLLKQATHRTKSGFMPDGTFIKIVTQYKNNLRLLYLHFHTIMSNILNDTYDIIALKKMIRLPYFKERLLAFILTLPPLAKKYILDLSSQPESSIYKIWHTARTEGKEPTIKKGVLKLVAIASSRSLSIAPMDKLQGKEQKETVFKIINDAQEHLKKQVALTIDHLSFIETAVLNPNLEDAFEILKAIKGLGEKDVFKHTLAFAGNERIRKFSIKIKEKFGLEAKDLAQELELGMKKEAENLQKIVNDMNNNMISFEKTNEIILKFSDFPKRIAHYLKSLPEEQEYKILRQAFSKNGTSLILVLIGKHKIIYQSDSYQRLMSLQKKLTQEKKSESVNVDSDPILRTDILYLEFSRLKSNFQADLEKMDIPDYPRLNAQIEICSICMNLLAKKELLTIAEQDRWGQEYIDINLFRESKLSFQHNDLSKAVQKLLAEQLTHKSHFTKEPTDDYKKILETTFTSSSTLISSQLIPLTSSIAHTEKIDIDETYSLPDKQASLQISLSESMDLQNNNLGVESLKKQGLF